LVFLIHTEKLKVFVPRFSTEHCPLVLLLRAAADECGALVECYWQGENRRTRRGTCHNSILSTINPI